MVTSSCPNIPLKIKHPSPSTNSQHKPSIKSNKLTIILILCTLYFSRAKQSLNRSPNSFSFNEQCPYIETVLDFEGARFFVADFESGVFGLLGWGEGEGRED